MSRTGIIKFIFYILLFLWMAFIFTMSSHEGSKSTGDSEFVGKYIGRMIYSDFDEWPSAEQDIFAERIDGYVRKGAHMFEYAILGFLLSFSVTKVPMCLIAGLLYAVSDEIHQYFVPNRSCQLGDVLIDFVGCSVCVLIIAAIRNAIGGRNK